MNHVNKKPDSLKVSTPSPAELTQRYKWKPPKFWFNQKVRVKGQEHPSLVLNVKTMYDMDGTCLHLYNVRPVNTKHLSGADFGELIAKLHPERNLSSLTPENEKI